MSAELDPQKNTPYQGPPGSLDGTDGQLPIGPSTGPNDIRDTDEMPQASQDVLMQMFSQMLEKRALAMLENGSGSTGEQQGNGPVLNGLSALDEELRGLYGPMIGRERSPFKVFLHYTEQKINAAKALASHIVDWLHEESDKQTKWGDIGVGEGTQHRLTVSEIHQFNPGLSLGWDLVEPEQKNVDKLEGVVETWGMDHPNYDATIIQESLEDAAPHLGTYKGIVCLHTIYHFFDPEVMASVDRQILEKVELMWDRLEASGRLYIGARDADQVYLFIKRFYEVVHGRRQKDITMENVDDALTVFAVERGGRVIDHIRSEAHVTIPFETTDAHPQNIRAAEQIVEFFLRKPWNEIDLETQIKILNYLEKRGYRLKQVDHIMVLEKPSSDTEGVIFQEDTI